MWCRCLRGFLWMPVVRYVCPGLPDKHAKREAFVAPFLKTMSYGHRVWLVVLCCHHFLLDFVPPPGRWTCRGSQCCTHIAPEHDDCCRRIASARPSRLQSAACGAYPEGLLKSLLTGCLSSLFGFVSVVMYFTHPLQEKFLSTWTRLAQITKK